ncbi:MAG: hypothetical protein RBT62_04145 [Spirochaetia bacterium]|jgi:hypothetical protein|nr:hypothetical protein [Spirochaetia bacterium]
MSRAKRRERWESAFDPTRLALTGVALSLALLFQPSLAGRAMMLVLAAIAAWVSGRKLSPVMTIVVMAGIVSANLLVPIGRKLLTIGPFSITENALLDGLQKAITFEALMFISKACLGPGLRLPGRFGAFFAEALRGYDRILERKTSVKAAKGFMKSVDEILVSVYDELAVGTESTDISHRYPRSAFRRSDMVLAGVVLASVLAVL